MRKILLITFFVIIGWTPVFGHNDSLRKVITPHVSPTLRFTENKGQWDDNILFRAQLDGGALFLEKNCLTFNFYDKKKYRALHHGGIIKGQYKDLDLAGHAYRVSFKGCNPLTAAEKYQQGSDYENFFVGSDQTKWKGEVRNYQQIILPNLYNNIDYEAITSARGLKYNFYVKPGADPASIQLEYKGINKLKFKNDALTFQLAVNEVIEQKPYAYQLINNSVKAVKCRYVLKNNILGFEFPDGYDKKYTLVIDPLLVFAAQSGSTADNFGMTATFDPAGNLYSGGTVFNVGYPTTLGAYSTSFSSPVANGNTDVVITKYNSSGSALLYSTYLGGNGTEIVTSLIVDKTNNLCFYGATGSANFPTTTGAYDNSFNGGTFLSFIFNGTTFDSGTDIYVGKFNSTGTSLLASTFLGGSGNDGVNHVNVQTPLPPPYSSYIEYQVDSLQYNYGDQYRGEIQLDVSNNIYIASSTRSTNFPTVNAFDNTLGGKQDGIIAKFNSNLTSLLYCSLIGGSSNDAGYGLIVKNNFDVYLTGGTCSQDFPYSSGGYQSSYQGGKADGYVIRISPTGTNVLNGTFFGTSSYDQTFFIQSDKYDDIYVYGQSLGNMPVLAAPNATTVFSIAGTHQFISRFNKTLTSLNLSTVFGNFTNNTDLSPCAFSIDKCNTIYLSGWGGNLLPPQTSMNNMPLFNPSQSATDGHDFYFMALDSNAVNLLYGSYLGGSVSEEHVDGGTSRFDPLGKIYQSVCAGCGGNDDFPVTPGAWPNTPGNPNYSGNCNNGVIKLDFQILLTISTINTNTLAGCVPYTTTFTNAVSNGPNSSYVWYLGNGLVTPNNPNPVVTYTNPGTYTVSLVVTNSTTCNKKDSSIVYITVYPSPTVNFSFSTTPCNNTITTNNTSSGNFGSNPYLWQFGNGVTSTAVAPSYTYPANGNYNLALTATDINGCSSTLSKPLAIFNFSPGVVSSSSICYGASTKLNASGGTSYTWSPGNSINNSSTVSPTANPTVTTIYTVNILNNSAGFPCVGTLTTQIEVNPTPTANFNYSVNPCGGGVYFFDLSNANITGWNWRLSSTITSTIQNPYNFYFNGGNFNIRLLVTNVYGCKDSIVKPISVLIPPPLTISSATAVCKNSSVQLSAGGGTAYAWTPTVSLDFPSLSNPKATPIVNTEYSCVVTTTNYSSGLPCSFLLITTVTVTPLSSNPVGAQADPKFVIIGNSTTLTYLGDPGGLVTWYPLGSTTPANGYTVSASPVVPTTYTAISKRGACTESAEVLVDAYSEGCIDKDFFVPNTFTPNNDGQNDLFKVRGLKIDELYFAVYNRWGEKVFDTNDKNKGWDGTYNGRQSDVGVFGWYLKVKCFNGEETFRKGNVTLIR